MENEKKHTGENLLAIYSLTEIERMGEALAKSGLFGFKKTEEAVALMLVAQSQGRHLASVAEEYDIIQGRPALRSRAALARYQVAGGRIEWLDRTESKVSARFTHPQGGDLVVTWDIARAKALGLADKDNWKKQPMIMMQWRVVAEGVRATYPACLSGGYIYEEVEDMEPRERNITPEPPRPEPRPPVQAPQETTPQKVSKAQIKLLFATAKETGFTEDEIKKRLQSIGFEHTADLTIPAFDAVMRWARGPQPPE